MKRIILWLVASALVALVVAMLLPARTGLPLNKNTRCKVILRRINAGIGNYRNEFGSYPTGDGSQILKKCFGGDPKRIEFLRIDPWGTPYVINFLSTNGFVISSAGKDKMFGDKDDIVFNSISNSFVKP